MTLITNNALDYQTTPMYLKYFWHVLTTDCCSLVLLALLSLLQVDPHQVGGREVALEEGDGRLEESHREAEDGQYGEQVAGAGSEVTEVQHGVEQLVAFNSQDFNDYND